MQDKCTKLLHNPLFMKVETVVNLPNFFRRLSGALLSKSNDSTVHCVKLHEFSWIEMCTHIWLLLFRIGLFNTHTEDLGVPWIPHGFIQNSISLSFPLVKWKNRLCASPLFMPFCWGIAFKFHVPSYSFGFGGGHVETELATCSCDINWIKKITKHIFETISWWSIQPVDSTFWKATNMASVWDYKTHICQSMSNDWSNMCVNVCWSSLSKAIPGKRRQRLEICPQHLQHPV